MLEGLCWFEKWLGRTAWHRGRGLQCGSVTQSEGLMVENCMPKRTNAVRGHLAVLNLWLCPGHSRNRCKDTLSCSHPLITPVLNHPQGLGFHNFQPLQAKPALWEEWTSKGQIILCNIHGNFHVFLSQLSPADSSTDASMEGDDVCVLAQASWGSLGDRREYQATRGVRDGPPCQL